MIKRDCPWGCGKKLDEGTRCDCTITKFIWNVRDGGGWMVIQKKQRKEA